METISFEGLKERYNLSFSFWRVNLCKQQFNQFLSHGKHIYFDTEGFNNEVKKLIKSKMRRKMSSCKMKIAHVANCI